MCPPNPPVLDPTAGNVPGMDYAVRVGHALTEALLTQVDLLNDAWSSMLRGDYTFGAATRLWARVLERYYDAAVELTRGPGYLPRPAWLTFTYSREQKNVLKDVARIDRTISPDLDTTPFAPFGNGAEQAGLYLMPIAGLASQNPAGMERTEIVVELNTQLIEQRIEEGEMGDGQYISFILPRARGPEPPLVIVMLRISP